MIAIYTFAATLILFDALVSFEVYSKSHISPLSNNNAVVTTDTFAELENRYTVFGFLPYWKLDSIEYLQLDLLTDIAYFGLRINSDGTIQQRHPDTGYVEQGYNNWETAQKLLTLINQAKKANVNFALTIVSQDNDITNEFLRCNQCWETLAQQIKAELNSKNLNDVVLNFEYEGTPSENTRNNYTAFVAYLKQELKKMDEDALLTVTAFADSNVKTRITKPQDLVKVSDQIFIMAYDFHYLLSDSVGPIAPISKSNTSYDLNNMMNDYLRVTPPEKLILGTAYYGYNWITQDSSPYSARKDGDEDIGLSTSQPYESIVDTILKTGSTVQWDNKGKTPYFSYISPEKGTQRVVHFENHDSLRIKYQLAKNKNLKGVGIWALGYDGGYQELWNALKAEFL